VINDSVYEKMESMIDVMLIVIIVLCVVAFVGGICLTIREKKRKNKGAWRPLLAGFVALGGAVLAIVYAWLVRNPDAGVAIVSSDSSLPWGALLLIAAAYGYGYCDVKKHYKDNLDIPKDEDKEL